MPMTVKLLDTRNSQNRLEESFVGMALILQFLRVLNDKSEQSICRYLKSY